MTIIFYHYRNGYDDMGSYGMNEVQSWSYSAYQPGNGYCYDADDNSSPHGCYELEGPGFPGMGHDGDYNY